MTLDSTIRDRVRAMSDREQHFLLWYLVGLTDKAELEKALERTDEWHSDREMVS